LKTPRTEFRQDVSGQWRKKGRSYGYSTGERGASKDVWASEMPYWTHGKRPEELSSHHLGELAQLKTRERVVELPAGYSNHWERESERFQTSDTEY